MKLMVISGGGSGFGRALASHYGKNGYFPILLGRDKNKLELAKQSFADSGLETDYYVCDITKSEDVHATLKTINSKYGTIKRLINNAGVGVFDTVKNLSTEAIHRMVDTNVKGTIFMTQTALKFMDEKETPRIINIISTAGLRGKVNESVYCASKFAIRGFTESLQLELKNQNITITAAYMGGMNTPFWVDSDHINNPNQLSDPDEVAAQMFAQDNGQTEIHIKKA